MGDGGRWGLNILIPHPRLILIIIIITLTVFFLPANPLIPIHQPILVVPERR